MNHVGRFNRQQKSRLGREDESSSFLGQKGSTRKTRLRATSFVGVFSYYFFFFLHAVLSLTPRASLATPVPVIANSLGALQFHHKSFSCLIYEITWNNLINVSRESHLCFGDDYREFDSVRIINWNEEHYVRTSLIKDTIHLVILIFVRFTAWKLLQQMPPDLEERCLRCRIIEANRHEILYSIKTTSIKLRLT